MNPAYPGICYVVYPHFVAPNKTSSIFLSYNLYFLLLIYKYINKIIF